MNEESPIDAALDPVRALLRSRRLDEALGACASAIERDPGRADAWFLRGIALAEKGSPAEAIASMARSFELEPAQPPGHHLAFANALLEAGEARRAEEQARLAAAGAAAPAPALVTLAVAQLRQGREAQALATAQQAIALDRDSLRAHSTLATILAALGRTGEAARVLDAASKRWPGSEPLRRLRAEIARKEARSLDHEGRVFDAIDRYRQALAMDDSSADCWNDLANAYANACLPAEAREAYRRALERDPAFHQAESNLLIGLHYDPDFDAGTMYRAHVAWAHRHARGLHPLFPARDVPPLAQGGRLRIGFLSPAFHEGPTAAFASPLLEHLDRAKFEVHAYQVDGIVDEATERMRGRCDAWHDVRGASDEEIAAGIAADGIHILVDLAGHAPGGRLLVLARKPAPVVATWLDYFDTTGLAAVDCLIGDPVSTPPEDAGRFSERIERIEPSRLCYRPPEHAPAVAPAPVLRNGYVTFGSFNRLPKLVPGAIALWGEVLQAIPSARLILKNAALADARMRDALAARFERHGIGRDRIEMRGHSPHARMLAEYGDVDIALDPFPYNGGLTTCEALWMGVPVVTLEGGSMISRQGASLLAAAGLREWVATGRAEFVGIAARWAIDLAGLQELRERLRPRLADSALLDGARFGRQFGDCLERLWSRRIATLPGKPHPPAPVPQTAPPPAHA